MGLSTSPTGSSSWCHPYGTAFVGTWNTRAMGSHRLPPREVRQYAYQGQKTCSQNLVRMMYEAMEVETKLQWKPHKVRYARNVERLLKNLKVEDTLAFWTVW